MMDRIVSYGGWVLLAGMIGTTLILACGTPYVRWGAMLCFRDPSGLRDCVPPALCHYVGLQGQRSIGFSDATSCPAFAMFPPRAAQ